MEGGGPATTERARKLSGHSGRKTDKHDARSVAIAAAHNRGLRRLAAEDDTVPLRLLLDRRWQLVAQRQRTICQLRAADRNGPAGAATHLSCKKAARLLATIRPVGTVEEMRKQMARELLADWRQLERRVTEASQRLS